MPLMRIFVFQRKFPSGLIKSVNVALIPGRRINYIGGEVLKLVVV